MEQVYKNKNGFWGMSSGLKYTREEVQEVHPGCYWHGHGAGMPVIEVAELEGKETRVHGGFPMYPAQSDGASSTQVRKPKGGLKGRGGV
jgi:hypothetical protein